jgi:hypothetical protein
MTLEDFTAELSDCLRRKGVGFRPKDVETFAAKAWTQEGRSPDLDEWVKRFLAIQGQSSFARSVADKPRRFGLRATGMFLLIGAAVSLTLAAVLYETAGPPATTRYDPATGYYNHDLENTPLIQFLEGTYLLLLCLAPCFLVLGIILTLAAYLAEPRFVNTARLSLAEGGAVINQGRAKHRFVRTALGVILAVICGSLVATAAFALSIYLVCVTHPENPNYGWNMMGIVIMWLPGAGGGAILGGILEARNVRHSWLIGGCLGGLIVGGYPLLGLL